MLLDSDAEGLTPPPEMQPFFWPADSYSTAQTIRGGLQGRSMLGLLLGSPWLAFCFRLLA